MNNAKKGMIIMKKLFKSITSAILSAVMLLSLTSAAFADASAYVHLSTDAEPIEFLDVPTTHWAHNIIEKATVKHLLNGYQTDIRKKVKGGWGWEYEFKPENTMSRMEFLSVIGRELTLGPILASDNRVGLICKTQNQRDAFLSKIKLNDNHWANVWIATAYSDYVLDDNDVEAMDLNAPITRGEIAKFISRLETSRRWIQEYSRLSYGVINKLFKEAWYKDYGTPDGYNANVYAATLNERANNEILNADTSETAKRIADWNNIPKEYQPYVANVYNRDIVNGYEDGTFGADKTVTRAEAAAVLVNFKEYVDADGRNR